MALRYVPVRRVRPLCVRNLSVMSPLFVRQRRFYIFKRNIQTGLPPLLIQAAGRDVCHDDSTRLAASARAVGVSVKFTEYHDAEHIWILNGPWRMHYPANFPEESVRFEDDGIEAPEAVLAINEMVAFVKAHCGVEANNR